MSFFEKMKQGASEAAKKAQQTVEITKLRAQISTKEKEKEKTFSLIGEAVYKFHSAGDWKKSGPDVAAYCQHIAGLEQDIQTLELKIKEAKHEKVCQCGKVVAREVKFCSGCGHQFEDREQAEAESTIIHTICRACRTANEPDAKFCGGCGIAL